MSAELERMRQARSRDNTHRGRGQRELEYELVDPHIFDYHRYFDVFVESAKGSPEETLVRITVVKRGPDQAERCR
jgi:hypothetical protein